MVEIEEATVDQTVGEVIMVQTEEATGNQREQVTMEHIEEAMVAQTKEVIMAYIVVHIK